MGEIIEDAKLVETTITYILKAFHSANVLHLKCLLVSKITFYDLTSVCAQYAGGSVLYWTANSISPVSLKNFGELQIEKPVKTSRHGMKVSTLKIERKIKSSKFTLSSIG